MNLDWKWKLLVVGLVAVTPHVLLGLEPEAQKIRDLKALHRGKAGIYMNLGGRRERGFQVVQNHPLIDAVILGYSWSELEPRKGTYTFDAILKDVRRCAKAGKGVVVAIGLYGQSVEKSMTPEWLYDQPGVRALTFQGGGQARGKRIRIPLVWQEGFVETYIEPMVVELAKRLDGHKNLWYVLPGFGHIGNMTCQPSAGGSRACLDAGWTPKKWQDYCRRVFHTYQENFDDTPMLVQASGILLRDRRNNHYQREAGELLVELGNRGAAVMHFSLEADADTMRMVYDHLENLLDAARKGTTRIGLGDDWPLWVPESRRRHAPTRGHGLEYFRRTMDFAFGGTAGIPPIPTTMLYCQRPEIIATHPESPQYRAEVARVLKDARDRLKKIDQRLFGKN